MGAAEATQLRIALTVEMSTQSAVPEDVLTEALALEHAVLLWACEATAARAQLPLALRQRGDRRARHLEKLFHRHGLAPAHPK